MNKLKRGEVSRLLDPTLSSPIRRIPWDLQQYQETRY